jgi:hypothetical protein
MHMRTLLIASALALTAPTASADPDPIVAAEHVVTSAAPRADARDAARYAERERHEAKVADYTGGGVVVVGISGTALLVGLLVLLIVL